ncbi:hypothetical protein DPV78_007402 [Talaromyces pinophilus]|nr:hypothetical protein DPV78_007402 [Talaromyces pinophilus]
MLSADHLAANTSDEITLPKHSAAVHVLTGQEDRIVIQFSVTQFKTNQSQSTMELALERSEPESQ